jgi:putative transposase
MSELFLLSEKQIRRIEPYFPLSHGVPRVDDRRVLSGIIFVIRNGLRWRDAPGAYGPPKTLYNRFIRWSRLGVFNRIFEALAAKGGKPDRLMIDATHLKAHRTAASLLKKGQGWQRFRQRELVESQTRVFPAVSDAPKEV